MARKTRTRKSRNQIKPGSARLKKTKLERRPSTLSTLSIAVYVFAFGWISYAVIFLMRAAYDGLEGLSGNVSNELVLNLIGGVKYMTASIGPALILAGLFTLLELLTTRRHRIATSYSLSFINLVISYVGFAAGVYLFELMLKTLDINPIWDLSKTAFSPAISPVIAASYFFVIDVMLYWVHRLEHTNKALWYLHKIHHAVEDMDAVSGAFHPLSNIIRWLLTILPLSLVIEINLSGALILASFLAGVHFVQHTRAPLHFGWFGKVIGDNKFHFIHHSTSPKYFNKNFAATFPIIDMMFGTYVEPNSAKLPDTGLSHLRGASSAKEFLSGKLQPRNES